MTTSPIGVISLLNVTCFSVYGHITLSVMLHMGYHLYHDGDVHEAIHLLNIPSI